MLLIIRMLTLHGWKGGITFAKIKKFEESSLFAISMLLQCTIYFFDGLRLISSITSSTMQLSASRYNPVPSSWSALQVLEV